MDEGDALHISLNEYIVQVRAVLSEAVFCPVFRFFRLRKSGNVDSKLKIAE